MKDWNEANPYKLAKLDIIHLWDVKHFDAEQTSFDKYYICISQIYNSRELGKLVFEANG